MSAINYELMQQRYPKQKAALTRALHIQDKDKRREAVIAACKKAVAEWQGAGGVWAGQLVALATCSRRPIPSIQRTQIGVPMTTAELLTIFREGSKPFKGGVIYRGSTGFGDSYVISSRLPDGFVEVEEWADGRYRRVWKSDKDRMILTYCEGDLDLTVHPNQRNYEEMLQSAASFYNRMKG